MGRRSILSVVFVAVVVAAGCSKRVDDASLATQIKSEMFSNPHLSGTSLEVTAKNGQVTLTGTVPSDAARYEAYRIANETPGVAKVTDQMTVAAVPPPMPAPSSQAVSREPVASESASPVGAVDKPRKLRAKSVRKASEENQAAEVNSAPPPAPQEQPEPQAVPVAQSVPAATPPPQPAQPVAPPPPQPKQMAVPANSTLTVRLIDGVDSAVNNAGEIFHASLESPLVVDNQVVVPRGADIYVRLVSASSAGRMTGKSELHLELVKMEFQGRSYPLVSSTYSVAGSSRGKNTAAKVGGGAALGAIIGAIAGGGKGAGIGAGVGAAGGAIYQGATKGKQVKIPAETRLDFQLEQPVTVTVIPRPVTSEEGQQ